MGSNNQLGARIVMSNKNFEDAKAVFDKYDGSYYQMVRDGQYEKYKTLIAEDNQIFVNGQASLEENAAGKVIANDIKAFELMFYF